jgi:hypothetical protein
VGASCQSSEVEQIWSEYCCCRGPLQRLESYQEREHCSPTCLWSPVCLCPAGVGAGDGLTMTTCEPGGHRSN